jgi:ubiquinone/menaquinone biosynthesis C-methylase UbiE
MTALTASRAAAAGFAPRIATLTRRFEELEFPPGSFDLIASCMSLHHVRGKGPLYRDFARWLSPGGSLRFADQILGATEAIQAVNWQAWLAFCRQEGHCSPQELRGLTDHAAAHDHYTPLEEHFQLMSAAGFRRLDCIWRNGMYGVVTAEKATSQARP